MHALDLSRRSLVLRASFLALVAASAAAAGCVASDTGDAPGGADPGVISTGDRAEVLQDGAAEVHPSGVAAAAPSTDEPCPPAESFARTFGEGARVLVVSRMHLPVTGVSACSAKVVGDDGSGRIVALDGDGRERDAAELIREEQRAARERYGALRPELHDALIGADPAEHVSIWIWAKVHIEGADRQAAARDPAAGEAHASEAARRAMAALAPIEAELSRRGIEIMDKDGVTPSLRAVVTVKDLRDLARMEEIMAIGSDDWPGRPTGTTWYSTIRGGAAHALATGSGQRVCVIEGSRPDDTSQLEIAGVASPTGYSDWHTRWTSGIIRNTSAIEAAPAASVYIGNWADYTPTPAAPSVWQWCMASGTRAINFSWSFSDGSPGGLSNSDMAMDYLTKLYPFPLFVPAAGNTGDDPAHATVHNRARSALVVGASNDMGTSGVADDVMAWFSSYKNPASTHGDSELPNLVAPGVWVAAAGADAHGTSGAAPQATGVAALIASRNAVLGAWPEVKRAILMASAVEDIDGAPITQLPTKQPVVDARDGAGLLDAARAVELAAADNWRAPGSAAASAGYNGQTLQLSSIPDNSYLTQTWSAIAPASGRMRFVLAFDGSATCNSDISICSGDVLDADLDIVVQNSAGMTLCHSSSFDSSWEICDLAVSAGQTFQIKVWKWNDNVNSSWIGLAWMHYTP